ncbi:hypothetical protein NFI96_028555 [Prochilodus magdalenae]|nr:hypothetical protein NFI96_028555 [Prochilodus magdalenae]
MFPHTRSEALRAVETRSAAGSLDRNHASPLTELCLLACSTSSSTNNSWDWIGHGLDRFLDVAYVNVKNWGQKELCNMILDCCAQQRTYEKFFGLLAGRFCLLKKEYMESFEAIFQEQYETIHRLETNKLRNVARLFAHLLYTDSVPWSVLECIKMSEETTTSSSRIFVKILFQELCAYMGLPRLNERLKDMTLQPFFEGLFPRDNPRNTRFAINFFTSIGLGGLTDELREHLKNAPKMIMTQNQDVESSDSSSSSSSSSSDSSSDSDSSDSENDSGSSSDSDKSSSSSSSAS